MWINGAQQECWISSSCLQWIWTAALHAETDVLLVRFCVLRLEKTVAHYKINSCLFKRSNSWHLLELSKFGSGSDRILRGNILGLLAQSVAHQQCHGSGRTDPSRAQQKTKVLIREDLMALKNPNNEDILLQCPGSVPGQVIIPTYLNFFLHFPCHLAIFLSKTAVEQPSCLLDTLCPLDHGYKSPLCSLKGTLGP